ncbi:MAG: DevR family CRISPR-associated autoregulator, partial [Vulcanisaeta sp.]
YEKDISNFDSNFKAADHESEAILDLCNDIHGFLIPDKQLKRDSLVEFSNAIPVLTEENLENVSKFAIQHNKVVPRQVTDKTMETMMPFKQEYASVPLYGFAASMDLGWILRPRYEGNGSVIQLLQGIDANAERKLRAKSSVLALFNLLMGSGSKQARALPIVKLTELMIIVSNAPIPNLVHGAYADYAKLSMEILSAYYNAFNKNKSISINVHCYGIKDCVSVGNLQPKVPQSLDSLIKSVIDDIENLMQ